MISDSLGIDEIRFLVTSLATNTGLDPDRFFNLGTPGSHEWWYFDAVSDDGLDAVVAIFFVGIPFDPRYGVAALRHSKNPARFPAPDPLDHIAVSLNWYRSRGATWKRSGRGKPLPRVQGYSLRSYGRSDFSIQPDPFRIQVDQCHVSRDATGYKLVASVPDLESNRTFTIDLNFRQAPQTESFELNLGSSEAPHHWILAAADCRVEGSLSVDGSNGLELKFQGRGYHDHNAGAEELSLAMKRWEWGRCHTDNRAEIYYLAEPRKGTPQQLWISCVDGRPEVRTSATFKGIQPWNEGTGSTHLGAITFEDNDGGRFARWTGHAVDSSPFYRRWLSEFRAPGARANVLGISELLNTRWLNNPLANWMIDYRLKRS